MSVRSSMLGSNAAGGERNSMRSWPSLAEISAEARAGMSARLMWSTVTLTPTWRPHSAAKGSNQRSWRGTKWLHCRILRSPDNFLVGSTRVEVTLVAAGPDSLADLPQAIKSVRPADAWMNRRRVRPD
jgi:hypothetical protein